MINNFFKGINYFVIFVLIQVLILNNIYFFRIAIPFLYIYFILKLPIGISRSSILLLSFLLGLIVDIFSNTPGMHAAACTFIGFLRTPVIRLYLGEDLIPELSPSYKTFGVGGFLKYAVTLVLLHHTLLYLIESFSLFDPLFLMLRIVTSFILSTILICTVEAFNLDSQKVGD